MPKFLQRRRRQWYGVLEIPKALRTVFGKPRFIQSLKTESLTTAEQRVLILVGKWKALIIDARRTGGTGNLALEAEVRRLRYEYDKLQVEPEDAWMYDDGLTNAVESIAEKYPESGSEVHARITGKAVSITEFVDDWLSTLDNEPKTIDMKKSDVLRFAQTFRLASDATQKKVRVWVDDDLVEKQGLSAKTARRIVSSCRGYWAYLAKVRDLEQTEPFSGAVAPQSRKKTKAQVASARKGFTQADVVRLAVAAGDNAQLRDLIVLAAYTGARIEELCSLKLVDVLSDRIKVVDAKTEAGWREIPIHSKIKPLVGQLKAEATGEYLLSGLSFNKYLDRSNAIGKRFGRLKAKLGFGGDYVFHSIRKGVATQFENAGTDEIAASRILGHEIKTMTYGLYSGGTALKQLAKAIEVLNYDGLP